MAQDSDDNKPVSARLSPGNTGKDTSPSPSDTRKGVQSVEHAVSVLQVFANSHRELGLKELADAVGMPASKAHHYLVSLVRSGMLRQTDTGCYDLGPFALQLGLSSLRRIEPIELAASAAKQLRNDNGEATFISVWGSYGATIIRYFEGFQPITVEARAGFTIPLAESATGQVFIAWENEQKLKPALAAANISHERFNNIRKATQDRGHGMVDGNLLPKIAALSAPVFDQDGTLVLAITQLGWSGELDTSADGQIETDLKRCTQQLCAELGYSPH